MPLAPRGPENLTTQERIDRAKGGLKMLLSAGRPVAAAYSGGKDSTVMVSLLLTAAVEFKEEGGVLPPILVTHANTGIENPAYQVVINHEIARIRAFAEEHELPVRVDIATPTLNDSWAVRIISGRALPTFANSSSRDCSVVWKLKPQERQRRMALKELAASGNPCVLVGTRYEESASRAARMRERQETDIEIWQQEVRDKAGHITRIENRMSPVAFWDDEDIWVYISQMKHGGVASYTDGQEVWDAYADGGGGGGCAVVGDESMKSSAKACGVRFGCGLCTAVGRDKSLESMIEADEKYGFMRNLNRLQRFLVDTQNHWNLRQWLGRSIDKEGFIAIEPDTYSPEMASFLLACCLTIDLEERVAAANLGIEPRFQLVSNQQLLAIDAVWSLQAYQARPFSAIKIWDQVINQGRRFYPPDVEGKRRADPRPERRYLWVGNYADTHEDSLPEFGGLIDPIAIAAGVGERRDQAVERVRLEIKDRRDRGEKVTIRMEESMYASAVAEAGGCVGVRQLDDGRLVMDMRSADMFEVDAEAAELFLAFEASRVLEEYHRDDRQAPTRAYLYYAQAGIIATTPQHLSTVDEMMRRSRWKIRHDLHKTRRQDLLDLSISKVERASGMKAPAGKQTLHEVYLASPMAQTERRYSKLMKQLDRQMSPGKFVF